MLLQSNHCLGDQWKAIRHNTGPATVIAGPGTGKTTTLANRIAYLVTQCGVDPKDILALTFNKKAADELNARANALLREAGVELEARKGANNEVIKGDDGEIVYQGADVRTYHSLGFMMAREVLDLPPWLENVVLSDSTFYMKQILGDQMMPLHKGGAYRRGMRWNDPDDDTKGIDPKDAYREISGPMSLMVTPSRYAAHMRERWGEDHDDLDRYLELWARYQAEKQLRDKIDFEDMLYVGWLVLTEQFNELQYDIARYLPAEVYGRGKMTVYKLKKDAYANMRGALGRYQTKWRYIMVDEAQDTNPLQGRMVTLLAQNHQNILVVGDPDQSIYKFRGARPDYIESLMTNEFRGHETYFLDHTRRFIPEIVTAANTLIAHNDRPEKYSPLKTARQREHGMVRAIYHPGGEFDQAQWMVREIRDRMGPDVDPEHVDPEFFNQFGIIARTNGVLAALEPALFSAGFPYRNLAGGSAFNRKEIIAAVAYAAILSDQATIAELCAVVNIAAHDNAKKTHYLGAAAVQKITDLCNAPNNQKYPPFEVLEGVIERGWSKPYGWTPSEIRGCQSFLQVIRRMRERVEELCGEGEATTLQVLTAAREMAVDEFVRREYGERDDESGDSRFDVLEGLCNLGGQYPTPSEFLALIRRLQEDGATKKDSDRRPAIQLGTAHRWKGLERDVIFIASMDDGVWPHKRTTGYSEDMQSGTTVGDIPEERRLAFVAVTRARQDVVIGYFGKSIFVEEMRLTPEQPDQSAAALDPLGSLPTNDPFLEAVRDNMNAWVAGIDPSGAEKSPAPSKKPRKKSPTPSTPRKSRKSAPEKDLVAMV